MTTSATLWKVFVCNSGILKKLQISPVRDVLNLLSPCFDSFVMLNWEFWIPTVGIHWTWWCLVLLFCISAHDISDVWVSNHLCACVYYKYAYMKGAVPTSQLTELVYGIIKDWKRSTGTRGERRKDWEGKKDILLPSGGCIQNLVLEGWKTPLLQPSTVTASYLRVT